MKVSQESLEDRGLLYVLLHNVIEKQFVEFFDDEDDLARRFPTASLEWRRHEDSPFGDIIAIELDSVYQRVLKAAVILTIEQAQIKAKFSNDLVLRRVSKRLARSRDRILNLDCGWCPAYSSDDLAALEGRGAVKPFQTLICEIAANRSIHGILQTLTEIFEPQPILPELFFIIDVIPFVNGRQQKLTTPLERIPDVYLKAYLYSRETGFKVPDQELELGDCDAHGVRHPIAANSVLFLPIRMLYRGASQTPMGLREEDDGEQGLPVDLSEMLPKLVVALAEFNQSR